MSEQNTSVLPSGENSGNDVNPPKLVTCSRPVPSRFIRYNSNLRLSHSCLLDANRTFFPSGVNVGAKLAQPKYEHLGTLRCEQGVPLEESVRGLFLIREKMLDYVEEHILTKDTLALYEEEELDRRLGRFFDLLTIHLVKGYERARRRAVAANG